MTATRQRTHARTNGNGQLRLSPAPRPRNVPWIVVGILLVVGGALAFSLLASRLAARQSVLALRRSVPAGQVIRAEDLKIVGISVDGQLRGIPAAQRGEVLGRPAAADLASDTLLTRADVGTGTGLRPGKAVVGLGLKASQLPADDLGPGSRVVLLDTGEPGASGPAEPTVLGEGRVTSVHKDDASSGGTVNVSVVVDDAKAPTIAAANAAGRIALVVVSR